MDKVQFKERWNNIFNSSSSNGCELVAKLFYKKPLESNETRLDRHHKQQTQNQKKRYQEHKEQVIEYRKKYYQEHKDKEIEYSKKYKKEHKDEVAFKEKRRQYQRKYYAKDPKGYYKGYYQRKKQERLLLENDEPKRATEELARFTQEERRAFDEWERQNQKHTV